MGTLANIVCKTVGVAGMSAVLYDAYNVGKSTSNRQVQATSADYFEKVHASTRTLSHESPVDSALQNKISDLRMKNPFVSIFAKIKGFAKGSLNVLGDNIVPISFAALAISTKGFFSKLGAWGVAGCALLKLLKEGFGIGKNSPMN